MKISYEDQLSYDLHMSICNEMFDSIDEYLISKLFIDGCSFQICKNKFPYQSNVFDNHFILWIKCSNENDLIYKIDNIINYFFKEKIYFENNIKSRSVLHIKHIHIFTNERLNLLI